MCDQIDYGRIALVGNQAIGGFVSCLAGEPELLSRQLNGCNINPLHLELWHPV